MKSIKRLLQCWLVVCICGALAGLFVGCYAKKKESKSAPNLTFKPISDALKTLGYDGGTVIYKVPDFSKTDLKNNEVVAYVIRHEIEEGSKSIDGGVANDEKSIHQYVVGYAQAGAIAYSSIERLKQVKITLVTNQSNQKKNQYFAKTRIENQFDVLSFDGIWKDRGYPYVNNQDVDVKIPENLPHYSQHVDSYAIYDRKIRLCNIQVGYDSVVQQPIFLVWYIAFSKTPKTPTVQYEEEQFQKNKNIQTEKHR